MPSTVITRHPRVVATAFLKLDIFYNITLLVVILLPLVRAPIVSFLYCKQNKLCFDAILFSRVNRVKVQAVSDVNSKVIQSGWGRCLGL